MKLRKRINDSNQYITQSRTWIEQFVIHHNLCPFAKAPFTKDKIAYNVVDDQNSLAEVFKESIEMLDRSETNQLSNIFIIFPFLKNSFLDFLDRFDQCQEILETINEAKDYQLVSFHPKYQFAETEMEDPINMTNRSPYPMIHILRVEEVAQAIEAFGDTDKILEDNQRLLHRIYGT